MSFVADGGCRSLPRTSSPRLSRPEPGREISRSRVDIEHTFAYTGMRSDLPLGTRSNPSTGFPQRRSNAGHPPVVGALRGVRVNTDDSSGADGIRHSASTLVDRFQRLATADIFALDDGAVARFLADVAGLHRFLQAREIDLNQRLCRLAAQRPGINPEAINAQATGRSAASAGRAVLRADQAAQAPEVKAQMDQGRLSAEHLDAFTAAVRSLEPRLQPVLRALEAQLVARAVTERATVEQFRTWVQREVRLIETDDGKQRLERQKRNTRLRWRTNLNTGMLDISGQFDPEFGAVLLQRLNDQLEVRLRQVRPSECPTDPLDAMDWLRAHAFIDLLTGAAAAAGKPEVIVVIDQQTFEQGRHRHSRVDCGPGIDLPIDTIRTIASRARFVPVVINSSGVVIAQGEPVSSYAQLAEALTNPVSLDHGRSRRNASTRQRRALRAMYRTCAIPGCGRHVSITEAHHIHRWEQGGRTDLANLIPLCRHHHDRLHAERWRLDMKADRSITIHARDGNPLMATGPPCAQWA